ncbi:putative RND superfamily exporter protein [Geomicrobium halophilum]|uniref:Putative RND superfamily exporter protein n=1 Tax=Geomicrobium halophilum TaxID=549000 RepID=A0A841PLH9_9BACL|nr:hypothetical protein [Geomicrobium halophilum]MBB6449717.1 putative RND superfamily exporter protein [Geomicrobium halophilum]
MKWFVVVFFIFFGVVISDSILYFLGIGPQYLETNYVFLIIGVGHIVHGIILFRVDREYKSAIIMSFSLGLLMLGMMILTFIT